MTHKLKTETFSEQIEHFGGVIVFALTSLFSFVTFHLNKNFSLKWTWIDYINGLPSSKIDILNTLSNTVS